MGASPEATPRAERLYTPHILALATELADYPLTDGLAHRASLKSRTCGSTIELGMSMTADGTVSGIGMAVSACAIGQASAAIFAISACGKTPADIIATGQVIESWLTHGERNPDWPGIEALDQARAYPGRHGAILLPWRAASLALSKVTAAS